MSFENPDREQIKSILKQSRAIAVVGLNNNPERPAYYVSEAMQRRGYRIIPVHPSGEDALGEKGYRSLADIPEPFDIVNVFVRSEATPQVAKEAAATGASTLWLQQGIYNEESARIAQEAGMTAIMDRCIKVEDAILLPKGREGSE